MILPGKQSSSKNGSKYWQLVESDLHILKIFRNAVISVRCKNILHWANVCFSEHEYFNAELAEF